MSLAEKLHPDRFTDMSGKMTAIVAYVLGEAWPPTDSREPAARRQPGRSGRPMASQARGGAAETPN